MEIIHGMHPIIHDNVLKDEYAEMEIMQLMENKKITIQKRTIKNKTYTSYLIGIPHNALDITMYDFFKDDNKKTGYTILEKINNQTYKLMITDEIKPGTIKIENIDAFDIKDKTYQITLPKKQIEYLQAYDEYLESMKYINEKYGKDFKDNGITAFVLINIAPVIDRQLDFELNKEVIIKFDTNIDDKFVHSMELLNDDIPGWLELLTENNDPNPSTFY